MIVVSNTTALINFSAIDQLDILRNLFAEIIIPLEVYNELKGRSLEAIQKCRWIKKRRIESLPSLNYLTSTIGLHPGEAAAFVLAYEESASYLLLDETHARKEAKRFFVSKKIKIISTPQILKLAEKRNIIKNWLTLLRQMYIAGYQPSHLDTNSLI